VEIREDGLPLDRCTDAAVAAGRLDPPFRAACGGVFPNVRWVLCALERGAEVFEGWLVDHETACI
jgi:hypothetical protein